ncbi:macro domain-containing protein [Micromonospora sp. STR1_7]|uniref:Macro domain-containing protein n=1 Tax=Micromonospora parastrephiae TaxID=2806101 RepID=A0ABS1XTR2_9ACTN|nr:macro domain-containing protein [Micromonospora parastrephiae]MBM0232658.1 macro domain-containing protein [Micromonospora parastrephiae]
MTQGNLLNSRAQTLVNTVNCVGIMGKGIALAFKRRYPEMFQDYVRRCDAGTVKLGKPYIFRADDHLIVNFPTKDHWRSVSRLEDIENGLMYLKEHLREWGVTSIAVPPLGCGNGQLDWSVVGPTLDKHLRDFAIPVELYVPHGVEPSDAQLSLLEMPEQEGRRGDTPRVAPGAIALVDILAKIEAEPYHWPVGRVLFQKIAYFATAAGIPTSLTYEANSYGPYAASLGRLTAQLQNNGLVAEVRRGSMIETRVGSTFSDAKMHYMTELQQWEAAIARVVDLVARFDSRRAEVAGSVHYVADALRSRFGRRPTTAEVIEYVEKWKIRRKPPIKHDDIVRSVVELAAMQWIDVEADDAVAGVLTELGV